MKNYTYSDQLTDDELADPIVAAAYAVAKKAHARQLRGKLHELPALVHPVLVYRMAKEMGETNSTFLAAALLHDTLEDYKPYRKFRNHIRMRGDLIRALEEQGVPEAEMTGRKIFNLVREVTKPDVYDHGLKILAQIDHMQHASIDGKRLKILDQTASLVCRLLGDNDPKKFDVEKEERFVEKATNLVQAILHSARSIFEQEAMQPYEHLYAKCLQQVQDMPRSDQHRRSRDYYRDTLNFEELFEQGPKPLRVVKALPKVERYYYPAQEKDKAAIGMLRIDFNADGRINGYVIRNDPGGGGNAANQWQETFMDALQQTYRLFDRYRPLQIEAKLQSDQYNASGRHFVLHPPVPPKVFAAAARLSKLLAFGESQKFEAKMEALGRGGNATAR